MRLMIATPVAVIEDAADVAHVRAEDETGAFGIMAGHADFVTVLPVSVVTFRLADGRERFVVVRGGVLTVREGQVVEIAARQAIGEDALGRLGRTVREELALADAGEAEARTTVSRLHLATMRQIQKVLDTTRHGDAPGWGAPTEAGA